MRPQLVAWLEQWLPPGVAQALAPTWFTMVGLAGLLCLWSLVRHARRDRLDPPLDPGAVATVVLAGYVAAVSAGIGVPAVVQLVEGYVADGTVRLRPAGMTSFWGYLGGLVAMVLMARRGGVPLGWLADRLTPLLGMTLVLVRTGCFLAGCDYGQLSSAPWAVRFPRGSGAWRDHVEHGLVPVSRDLSLPVHPTQLYEAALGLAIALGAWLHHRRAPVGSGRTFLAAAALYATARLGIENLRGDEVRGLYLGLSSGQLFSLAVLLALATVAARARWRPAR